MTFGGTRALRGTWGANENVNFCSGAYTGGGYAGVGVSVAAGGGGIARAAAGLRGARGASALTEVDIGLRMESILGGARLSKNVKSLQFDRLGGMARANADFDALAQGVSIVSRGGGLRTATLSNGTKINVRPFSSGDRITLEVVTPGNPAIKVRY